MKKIFTLLFVFGVMSTQTYAQSSTPEYTSLGIGYMTDDMVTGMLDCDPVTYPVEILQAGDTPYYRVMAPYGKAFATAMYEVNNRVLTPEQYDADGKCYIDIDASDPENVIFHKTMTGCDLGAGEFFIGINTSYNVVFKDGVFTGPLMSIAVGIGDSAIAGNRRGKFRIVLPGVELSDFDITLTPASQCLTERKFKGSLTVGEAVTNVKYSILAEWQEDGMMSAVKQIAEKGADFAPRGEFSYETDDYTSKETIVVVALDAGGNIVGYDWCTYYFDDDDPSDWIDCGNAQFTDGFLQDLIKNIPSQTTTCALQRSTMREGVYRLVNPYAGLEEYPLLNTKHSEHNHYIFINAADPECIYIEESPIGMESSQYGLMRVSSFVFYFLQAGYDLEDCKDLELGAIVENGVMTFPEEALLFSMMKFDNADWWTTDSDGTTKIVLPEGFDFTASISEIVSGDAPSAPEYFNLQGIRIAQPESGTLYIKREGSKTTKILVR